MENHPDVILLSAYMDNELSHKDRQQFEEHASICEQCQHLMQDLLSLRNEVMIAYQAFQAPDNMEEKIFNRIQTESSNRSLFKAWIALLLVGFFAFNAVWFLLGSVAVKLLSGLMKFILALLYVFSHFIASVPLLTEVSIILSIGILVVSSFSLRRLLQTTSS